MTESNKQTEFGAEAPLPAGEPSAPQGGIPAQGKPIRPIRAARSRDIRLAVVLLAFCALLWDCLLWAEGLGLGEAVALTGVLAAAVLWLRGAERRRSGYGTLCCLLLGLGAVSPAFSGDDSMKHLTLQALILLFLVYIVERRGLRTGTGLRARVLDLLSAAFSIALGRLPESWAALFRGDGNDVRRKRFNGMLLGLLCAVPVLIVLVPLLASADAAFDGLMRRLDTEVLLRAGIALSFGFVTALLVFTLLFTSDRGTARQGWKPFSGLEPSLIAAFLAAVSTASVLYLAAQFAYFTDAFRGLLPKDFTVAEYARRGFFEMCGIVSINLGLIVAAIKLCRKPAGKLPGGVKALALFLCLFSLILVATALSKMVLYMNTLGLTRKRVLTSVFMVYLALILSAVSLRLFGKRIPVPQFALVLGAAILITLSLVNVDGIVARYNVDAWRGGRLDSLDVQTVCELGDGAVPTLAELLDDKDPEIAKKAREELRERLAAHGLAEVTWRGDRLPALYLPVNEPDDLRSWNLISARARAVLLENQDRILADPE